MREINRSRYLRGTRTWAVRNWFVFGGMAFTLLTGVASVLMFPDLKEHILQRTEEEKATKLARRVRLEAIQKHREELEQERSSHNTE